MKYALVFGTLGAYLLATAAFRQGFAWLLAWPGISLLVMAAAYAGLGPRLLGKRADGRLAWWALALLAPYLLLTWGVWHLQRLLGRLACAHEVAPGLWLGRRPLARELPPAVDLVVDLTAEFPAARGVVRGRAYRCLPVLDAHVPDERALRALVEEIAAWPGPVYVHCALGRGRSALVAAAVLVARGLAADGGAAEAALRRVRPAVRLGPAQRRLLERLAAPAAPVPGP